MDKPNESGKHTPVNSVEDIAVFLQTFSLDREEWGLGLSRKEFICFTLEDRREQNGSSPDVHFVTGNHQHLNA